MTGPGAVQRLLRPVQRWTPPLDHAALGNVLAKVRRWQPFDGGALLDDVASALDDVIPEEAVEKIAQRLRGHLMQLVTIAVATEAGQDTAVAQLIERARALRTNDVPGDYRKAVGHLRRMGWTAGELLERLVAMKHLKEAT
ncbi:DUF6415 family natural product biosynthesis protein [Streptomyces sp. Tu 3180]|uniref:DUF6415 family natural product biosynthesis protein n=1 Tax=Streptomyces sp. Tu 3180 TaxID=2682611 RepID=UPI00140767D6|nr:DUF6415 family natural product biosynthesis protein [Streptomyces sp. Tu 3180]KAF3470069.1 hypothetical protein GL259_00800 [Streptomyces sp. Tu 3180]